MNIISVKSLTKKFNGLTAVNNLSFNVKEGEIFGFLGPNGAGKSTTIKILTTLLKPEKGKIKIGNYDPITSPDKVREIFGIVFQDQSIDEELTAYENLNFHAILYNVPRNIKKQRIEMLLKMVQLWDRKNDLVKKYSGGMKRRLEIARGLLHHPKILFLDEPTIGLDPQTRKLIWEHILELNKKEGITVFFTTQYIEEASKYAERIAIIDNGKLVANASPKELKIKTKTRSLEDAFIKLTGKKIRYEESNGLDRMRLRRRMFRK